MPPPLDAKRPTDGAFGAGLVLAPKVSETALGSGSFRYMSNQGSPRNATPLNLPALRVLARGNPGGTAVAPAGGTGPERLRHILDWPCWRASWQVRVEPWSAVDEILELIPHQGAMCLLDEVASRGRTTRYHLHGPISPCHRTIHCDAMAGCSAVCGIEYGLQAAALHGALVSAACSNRPATWRRCATSRSCVSAGWMIRRIWHTGGDGRHWKSARRAGSDLPASHSRSAAGTMLLSGRAARSCCLQQRTDVRRALVTGGASTLGAAICRRLARMGCM